MSSVVRKGKAPSQHPPLSSGIFSVGFVYPKLGVAMLRKSSAHPSCDQSGFINASPFLTVTALSLDDPVHHPP